MRAEASGKLAGLLTLRRLVFRGKHGACAMHGLINRSIEVLLRDTYGAELWLTVAGDAALGFDSFEATDLPTLLSERGVGHVVITGAQTDRAGRVAVQPG